MEVASYTAGYLDMGHNARFSWSGHGSDDLILKAINSAQLRNSEWMQGTIELSNGLVDLTYHGAISTDAWLSATNVHFYASDLWEAEMSEVWKWYGSALIEDCRFEHVELRSLESKLTIRNSDFIGPNSGVQLFEGAYLMSGCHFDNAMCNSTDLQAPSLIADSKFIYNSGVIDWGPAEVMIRNCDFESTENSAIDKTGGLLSLKCSNFKSCGPITIWEAELNMSTQMHGGRNSFRSVSECIMLNDATGLYLDEGANDFSGCYQRIIEGTYDTACVELECTFELPARQNHWGYDFDGISQENGLMFPPQDLIRVYPPESSICAGWESGISCHLALIDLNPIKPVGCIDVIKEKSAIVSESVGSLKHIESMVVANTNYNVEVYDVFGRLVGTYEQEEGSRFEANHLSLASGLYVLAFTGKSETFSVRRFIE